MSSVNDRISKSDSIGSILTLRNLFSVCGGSRLSCLVFCEAAFAVNEVHLTAMRILQAYS